MAAEVAPQNKNGQNSRQNEDDENKQQVLVPETKTPKTENKEETGNDEFLKNEGEMPSINTPRVSGDGNASDPDDINKTKQPILPPPTIAPTIPGSLFGGDRPDLVDLNFYQHKKTLAKGMMDLALFSANANQLRYVMECRDRHPYFYPAAVLISFSLICQVVVGVALLWNSMYNVKHEMQQANRANNWTVIAVFLVTATNVFVSAFGVANPPPVT